MSNLKRFTLYRKTLGNGETRYRVYDKELDLRSPIGLTSPISVVNYCINGKTVNKYGQEVRLPWILKGKFVEVDKFILEGSPVLTSDTLEDLLLQAQTLYTFIYQ